MLSPQELVKEVAMIFQICAFAILTTFYAVYVGKMLSQKRRGIRTDQIALGKKPYKVIVIEIIMKFATYSIIIAKILSIGLNIFGLPAALRIFGLTLAAVGTAIFAVAVWTMHDSWRAGIPEKDKTEMVTDGIYQYSRNPAFLGFDLMYFGVLMAFFNWALLALTLLAVTMLHLQILQEETFLQTVFGQSYLDYKVHVRRYLGRK